MQPVATLEELRRAVAEFRAMDLNLLIEPGAFAAARQSLDLSGLLLVGEVHGVRENPVVLDALMAAFGLNRLALEWPEELAPVIGAFLAQGTLPDHQLLWLGDGRITVGHLAVLRGRAAAGGLALTLIDSPMSACESWSQRDAEMARRVLAAPAGTGVLVAAGNAHTRTTWTLLGVPLGADLARERPGVREIRIRYGRGTYYNGGSREFRPTCLPDRQVRLHQRHGQLVLDIPTAHEALVPHPAACWT